MQMHILDRTLKGDVMVSREITVITAPIPPASETISNED
jgi:hypothetical protein